MTYSLDNILISMFVNVATELRTRGWNIFWHASGETDAFTAGSEQGTISLIQDIPEDPIFIVKPVAGDYTKKDQIVLPAFAISLEPPRRIQRMGLGDTRWEREVDLKIGGIVTDRRQQAAIATTLYDWLQIGDEAYYMSMWDYTDPNDPDPLTRAELWAAYVTTPEINTEVTAIRYQINIDLILRYVE